jgi:hypothetical protein
MDSNNCGDNYLFEVIKTNNHEHIDMRREEKKLIKVKNWLR